MKLIKIDIEGVYLNPDQVVYVNKDPQSEGTLIRLSNGTTLTSTLSVDRVVGAFRTP